MRIVSGIALGVFHVKQLRRHGGMAACCRPFPLTTVSEAALMWSDFGVCVAALNAATFTAATTAGW